MKRLLFLALLMFSFNANAAIVPTTSITYGGQLINVTYVHTSDFATSEELVNLLAGQAWWGDEIGTTAAITSVGFDLGQPDGVFGPIFVYNINDWGNTEGGVWHTQWGGSVRPVGPALMSDRFYAVDLSRGLTPPEVPVPAAVWLFGSGLLGLVAVARRKKV